MMMSEGDQRDHIVKLQGDLNPKQTAVPGVFLDISPLFQVHLYSGTGIIQQVQSQSAVVQQ